MISEIQIQNFSIIESARVQFNDGFQALSGETGAGKSFLVQAISFALGSRADADSIRAGAKEASVTILFENVSENKQFSQLKNQCEELGIDLNSGEDGLFLRRTLNVSGRSRGFVNDQPVTLKTLQRLGQILVHQVGQHAARQLMDELFLLNLLDRFGNHEPLLKSYQESLRAYQDSRDSLENLKERVAKAREQEDFLRFQRDELKGARLRKGEEEELEQQRDRLKHRVTLATQSFEISQLLGEGEDSISSRLGRTLTLAEKARGLDETLKPLVESLAGALEHVETAERGFNDYGQALQEDPLSYDQIENRLVQIQDLKRKHRLEESGLIEKLEQLEEGLLELEDFEENLKERKEDLEESKKNLKLAAENLRDHRKKSALEIGTLLKKKLKSLALPHSKISWEVIPLPTLEEYRSHGGDELRLLVSFNPGEEMRPFQEVISGGELSRLLLAIYEVLYPAKMFGSFIFDEVDAGVSGNVAELIGRKLALLGQETQVFCITHLPQIACQAEWHYAVEKEVKKGRTFSGIRLLKGEERVSEIARMLAGVSVTEQALEHARELLKKEVA